MANTLKNLQYEIFETYKNYFNDLLFNIAPNPDSKSGDSIIMLQKPEHQCGSTTLILNYVKNRIAYEENYNMLIVYKTVDDVLGLNTENVELNNIVDLIPYPTDDTLDDVISNKMYSEIIMLDYVDGILSDKNLIELYRKINKATLYKLIAEYAPT